jgi:hypothetical protein
MTAFADEVANARIWADFHFREIFWVVRFSISATKSTQSGNQKSIAGGNHRA